MKTKNTKGIISISIILTIGVVILGGVTTFWQTARSTDEKINTINTAINKEISETNQRVTSVEKGFEMMLENQKTMMEDIKTLISEK